MANKTTDWYPPDVKPIRVGVYHVFPDNFAVPRTMFAHWDGKNWRWFSRSFVRAIRYGEPKISIYMHKGIGFKWRGLAKPTRKALSLKAWNC